MRRLQLVFKAGCGKRLCQFLIAAVSSTLLAFAAADIKLRVAALKRLPVLHYGEAYILFLRLELSD